MMAPVVDDVLRTLAALARDRLPALIENSEYASLPVSEWARRPARRSDVPDPDDPLVADALHAIGQDEILKRLLDSDRGVFVMFDYGRGSRLDASSVPGVLVHSAYAYASARTGPLTAEEDMISALADDLPRIRRLVEGEAEEAIFRAAFQDVALPAETRLATPWGTLRAVRSDEQRYRPFGAAVPAVMLENVVPVRIRVGEPPTPDPLIETALRPELLRDPEQLGLAMALTLGADRSPAFLWEMIVSPLSHGTEFSGRGFLPQTIPRHPGPSLTKAQQEEMLRWSRLIFDHYDHSIAIAHQRLLSAVQQQQLQESLIDAVIVWENLVGHGANTEMTFRVTTALTILLEPDSRKRGELRRELAAIYNLRSTIVHGGQISARANIAESRRRALEVAVAALKVLFAHRPWLISEADRGMKLILGDCDRPADEE
jgi:hypothetical protein